MNLDPAVGLDGLSGQRAVGLQCVTTMLPQDDCFDAVGSRTVGDKSVLSLFPVAIAGEAHRDARGGRVGERKVDRIGESSASPNGSPSGRPGPAEIGHVGVHVVLGGCEEDE